MATEKDGEKLVDDIHQLYSEWERISKSYNTLVELLNGDIDDGITVDLTITDVRAEVERIPLKVSGQASLELAAQAADQLAREFAAVTDSMAVACMDLAQILNSDPHKEKPPNVTTS